MRDVCPTTDFGVLLLVLQLLRNGLSLRRRIIVALTIHRVSERELWTKSSQPQPPTPPLSPLDTRFCSLHIGRGSRLTIALDLRTALGDHNIGRLPFKPRHPKILERAEARVPHRKGLANGMHELVSCAHFVVRLTTGEGMMNFNIKPIGRWNTLTSTSCWGD